MVCGWFVFFLSEGVGSIDLEVRLRRSMFFGFVGCRFLYFVGFLVVYNIFFVLGM